MAKTSSVSSQAKDKKINVECEFKFPAVFDLTRNYLLKLHKLIIHLESVVDKIVIKMLINLNDLIKKILKFIFFKQSKRQTLIQNIFEVLQTGKEGR